jgi:AcrR family transcriptional regulator
MASHERREREKEELRGKILDAARNLFIQHGYEAVSMRKIAEAIEYSPTAIYVHFKDKQELMLALCRCDFGGFSAECIKLATIEDPIERICQLGLTYIRFAVEHPNHYRLMFMTSYNVEGPQPTQEDLERKKDPTTSAYALVKQAVEEAINAGRFRPELTDSELLVQVIWGGVHGIASLEITHAKDPWMTWRSIEDRAQLMVDVLLRGLVRGGGTK